MPAFATLIGKELDGLVGYLTAQNPVDLDPDRDAVYSSTAEGAPMKYRITGSNDFLDPDGYPAIKPPWGTLSAIDLNTGKYLWKIPLGEYAELAAKGLTNTGSENYGGPIVTAGDVLFIGATVYDKKFRAFDSLTGKLLWETVLPNSAIATPATYMIDGKQYVVVSAAVEEKIRKDRLAVCMWRSLCLSGSAHTSWQGKGNVSSRDRRLHGWMSGKIVRTRGCLRRRAKNDIFTAVDLVHRRHTFESGIDFRFPQHLTGGRVESANFAVASSGEDQAPSRHHRTNFRKMRARILNPFCG